MSSLNFVKSLFFMIKYTFLFSVFFLFSCATNHSKVVKSRVYIEDNKLIYIGKIEKTLNEKAFLIYDESIVKPTTLAITSQGGEVHSGLDLGEWIHEKGINVEVVKGCASSCANYVFLAGKKKILHKDSVLIWHGNSYQSDMNEKVKDGEEYAVIWRKREDEFYKSIGIDAKIAYWGLNDISFFERLMSLIQFSPIIGFDYSIQDMEKLGVTNIYLKDGEWEWRKYRKFNVKRVSL